MPKNRSTEPNDETTEELSPTEISEEIDRIASYISALTAAAQSYIHEASGDHGLDVQSHLYYLSLLPLNRLALLSARLGVDKAPTPISEDDHDAALEAVAWAVTYASMHGEVGIQDNDVLSGVAWLGSWLTEELAKWRARR